jgi:hypothetical protein
MRSFRVSGFVWLIQVQTRTLIMGRTRSCRFLLGVDPLRPYSAFLILPVSGRGMIRPVNGVDPSLPPGGDKLKQAVGGCVRRGNAPWLGIR